MVQHIVCRSGPPEPEHEIQWRSLICRYQTLGAIDIQLDGIALSAICDDQFWFLWLHLDYQPSEGLFQCVHFGHRLFSRLYFWAAVFWMDRWMVACCYLSCLDSIDWQASWWQQSKSQRSTLSMPTFARRPWSRPVLFRLLPEYLCFRLSTACPLCLLEKHYSTGFKIEFLPSMLNFKRL